jgi:hypothetical protein
MVQKFRYYKRVRSNKEGFVRFAAVGGSKAQDRYVRVADVAKNDVPPVGGCAKFQRYTNHNTTTYDLVVGPIRYFSYVA